MTSRLLPPEEWHRLAQAGLETVWAQLPDTTRVIVVEDEGRIVGCVTGMLILHAEGLWIAPEYRKRVSVWRRLIAGFWSLAAGYGCAGAWAASVSEDMTRVLQKMGAQRLPGDHYVIRRKEQ